MNKDKVVSAFIVTIFTALYFITSIISTIHVIDFFELSNPRWLSIFLAVAFEIGAAASLASIVTYQRMNKLLVWFLFITLTLFQAMGNVYYSFVNLSDFSEWVKLFGMTQETIVFQKRILSIISGAVLPVVALGFIKALTDYIRPSNINQKSVSDDNSNTQLEDELGIKNDDKEATEKVDTDDKTETKEAINEKTHKTDTKEDKAEKPDTDDKPKNDEKDKDNNQEAEVKEEKADNDTDNKQKIESDEKQQNRQTSEKVKENKENAEKKGMNKKRGAVIQQNKKDNQKRKKDKQYKPPVKKKNPTVYRKER